MTFSSYFLNQLEVVMTVTGVSNYNSPTNTFTITNINKMSCMRMSIYELKSFNVTKVMGKRIGIIPIKNDIKVRKFKTKGEVTPISMSDINDGYYYNWNIVNDKFGYLKRDEYIKKQNTYIDCGYIDGDLTIDIKSLEDLYKKYKIV